MAIITKEEASTLSPHFLGKFGNGYVIVVCDRDVVKEDGVAVLVDNKLVITETWTRGEIVRFHRRNDGLSPVIEFRLDCDAPDRVRTLKSNSFVYA